ncbi:MAG: hypothetical protein P8J20_15995 [Novosphingobium sp.]|nr:hypothetical protein [Novosphingobium sp.]
MDAIVKSPVGENVRKLMSHMADASGYDIPYDEIRDTQVAAINERLQEKVDTIKVVRFRAEEAGISEITSLDDIVPLLLPHTAYKSYPESFLVEEKWDRLTKWLGTVSSHPTDNVDLDGIDGIDEWIDRLVQAGHIISCSSGTTGKAAILPSSPQDTEFVCDDGVVACSWGSGVTPAQDRLVFGIAPVADLPRNLAMREALFNSFGIPGSERFNYPVPSITIGSITRMITLRKRLTEGTATPSEIAEFEENSALRQKAVDEAAGVCADALIAARHEKLYISGFWAALYGAAKAIRERGFSGKDFHPDNTCYIGGGLKGAVLPDDYREFVFGTLNLKPERNYQMYGMQEIQTSMPRCTKGGRYHIAPWLVPLILDKAGEKLMPIVDGKVEGRAAFFDLSLDGRWGGVISGDRVELDYSPCECGARSPSLKDNIGRFKDLEGDDKITCSGTVDAYVRGVG